MVSKLISKKLDKESNQTIKEYDKVIELKHDTSNLQYKNDKGEVLRLRNDNDIKDFLIKDSNNKAKRAILIEKKKIRTQSEQGINLSFSQVNYSINELNQQRMMMSDSFDFCDGERTRGKSLKQESEEDRHYITNGLADMKKQMINLKHTYDSKIDSIEAQLHETTKKLDKVVATLNRYYNKQKEREERKQAVPKKILSKNSRKCDLCGQIYLTKYFKQSVICKNCYKPTNHYMTNLDMINADFVIRNKLSNKTSIFSRQSKKNIRNKQKESHKHKWKKQK